jgi:hypothetical protein
MRFEGMLEEQGAYDQDQESFNNQMPLVLKKICWVKLASWANKVPEATRSSKQQADLRLHFTPHIY